MEDLGKKKGTFKPAGRFPLLKKTVQTGQENPCAESRADILDSSCGQYGLFQKLSWAWQWKDFSWLWSVGMGRRIKRWCKGGHCISRSPITIFCIASKIRTPFWKTSIIGCLKNGLENCEIHNQLVMRQFNNVEQIKPCSIEYFILPGLGKPLDN